MVTRRNAEGRGLLLLKPKKPSNSHRIAAALASFDGVREVMLASGDYAFIVAADIGNERSIKTLSKRVRRRIGRVEISVASGHYVYRN
ncbi:MAG: hypothetical protein ACREBF_02005 [Candidatus Micrarchaeales archaeon]